MTTSRDPSARTVEQAPNPHLLFVTVQTGRARETVFTTPERAPDLLNVTNPQTGLGEWIQGPATASGEPDDGTTQPTVPDAWKALV